jgi:lysozyme family protein
MSKILTYILLTFATFTAKSADFEAFFPHLIKVEGTFFTVTQYDAGGATKYGVTIAVYKTWCNGKQVEIAPCDKDNNGKITANDLRLTFLQDVKPIYKTQYWDVCKGDLITNQAVAENIVDMVVHCGIGYDRVHIKAIQRIVGVVQDGKIGPKTLRAINQGNSEQIYNDLTKYRKSFYKKLTLKKRTQKKFLKGWYKRLSILKSIHYNEKVSFSLPFGSEPVDVLMCRTFEQINPISGFSFESASNCRILRVEL